MATINVSQADFDAVAGAAWEAKLNGDPVAADALDKLARKINAALSNRGGSYTPGVGLTPRLTWEDVPSVFAIGR